MTLGENGTVTRREYEHVRNWIYLLSVVTCVGILLTVIAITWVRTDAQGDTRRVGCANSQALIDQFEFLKRLAVQNQTGLTQKQVQERAQFYLEAEILARQRAGNSCASLADMRHQAQMDISHVLGGTP